MKHVTAAMTEGKVEATGTRRRYEDLLANLAEKGEYWKYKDATLCVEFTHQKMHFYSFKEHIKIYIKIHINIAPTVYVTVFDHHQGAYTEPG